MTEGSGYTDKRKKSVAKNKLVFSNANFVAYAKNKGVISIPETQRDFAVDYYTVLNAVNELVKSGVLNYLNGVKYECTMHSDISEVLNESPEDTFRQRLEEHRARIEARRQELMTRHLLEDDDEDDDDVDEEIANLFNSIEDDKTDAAIREAIEGLGEGFSVKTEEGKTLVELPRYGWRCNKKQIELTCEDGEAYFTDGGTIFNGLKSGNKLNSKGMRETVESVAQSYRVTVADDVLKVQVPSKAKAVECFLQLYAAMECISNVDETMVSGYFEKMDEDRKCLGVIFEIIRENPGCNRKQIIRCAKKKYNAVKNGGDFSKIFYLVKAINEFSEWSDSEFEGCVEICLNSHADLLFKDAEDEAPYSKNINMGLKKEPFTKITEGKKTVEVRLFDEKRRALRVGDIINFTCSELGKKRIIAKITALHKFDTFIELFSAPEMLKKAGWGDINEEQAAKNMYGYYTEEQEKLFGVLGIEFKVVLGLKKQ